MLLQYKMSSIKCRLRGNSSEQKDLWGLIKSMDPTNKIVFEIVTKEGKVITIELEKEAHFSVDGENSEILVFRDLTE